MSVLTSRHVLRYQAYPGARLRAHKKTAYRDLAARRMRRMLNYRQSGVDDACDCEADWYEDGRLVDYGTCMAHRWFREHDDRVIAGAIIARYARLLASADRRGVLESAPVFSESEREPATARHCAALSEYRAANWRAHMRAQGFDPDTLPF